MPSAVPSAASPLRTPTSVPAAQNNTATEVEGLAFALTLLDPAPVLGIEDGVVATRALSSRGGMRAPLLTPTPAPAPSPSPTPVPTPKPALKPQTYVVQPGDTLLAIAAKYGITPETILWASNLRNAELLQIGQELTILPVSGVMHTVQKGESLGGIAEAYLVDRSKIIEVNVIKDPDRLQEGQLLVIPGGMRRTTEPITGLPSAPSSQDLASAPKHTVRPGDTLWVIAEAYGVRPSAIQVANGIMAPDMLRIGMVLSIPGGAQQALASRPQPAPAPPPPPPAAGSTGDRITAIAQQYVGYRYVWGGHSPSGFDCSGYTWYIYKQAGVGIPVHDLWGQLNAGPRVSWDQLQPGDLVFWQNTYKAGLSHSGIYLGGGRFINAETEAVGVQIRSMNDPYWRARFYGASRPR